MMKTLFLRKENFQFTVSCLITIVLGAAAYGKWFYPIELLKTWERGIALFEILLICLLWVFRKSSFTWLGLILIFSGWSGYAFFWYTLKLPCSCMGQWLHIPSSFSICIDLLFIFLSALVARQVGKNPKAFWTTLIFILPSLGAGYAMGYLIYTSWIAP